MIPDTIRARSACKINLTLDVIHRREDGYHELDSIVHTVGLWDELVISPGGSGFMCNVALPDDNLCTKAVARWMAAQPETPPFSTVHIQLQKNLPIGAGMGGGSGNAAAVLLALEEWQCRAGAAPLSTETRYAVAASLGADVPLFMSGGAQRMQAAGEQLSALSSLNAWIVLLKPPVFGDTRAVFSAWGERQNTSERMTPRLLDVWKTATPVAITDCIGNHLADAARRTGQPVDEVIQLLLDSGALGASLTGSGAACFGLYADEAAARSSEAQLQSRIGDDWYCAVATLCAQGVQIL